MDRLRINGNMIKRNSKNVQIISIKTIGCLRHNDKDVKVYYDMHDEH